MMFGPSSDHNEIRSWAAQHGAKPVQAKLNLFDSEPAKLHFIFGDLSPETHPELKLISWETFFALFDELKLVLVSTGSPGKTQFELMRREPAANSWHVPDGQAVE